MKTPKQRLNQHVLDKGLTINQYKGAYQAKRVMMRAGLPADVIETALSQHSHSHKTNAK